MNRVRKSTELESTPPLLSTKMSAERPPNWPSDGVLPSGPLSCSKPPFDPNTAPIFTENVESFSEPSTESSSLFTDDTSDRVCPRKKPSSTPVNPLRETSSRSFPHKVSRLFTRDSTMTTRRSSRPPTLPRTSLPRKSFKKFTMRSAPETKSEPSSCTGTVSTDTLSERSMERTPGLLVNKFVPIVTTTRSLLTPSLLVSTSPP
mmetsp:Transcript_1803/g.4317  ORF Transcript_1803/g.4317 Transcript_1803/m.4317 type:complete len:204 (-) Transcript_1803:421-1032(-)